MSELSLKQIFATQLSLFLETLNKILLNASNYFFDADFETWGGRFLALFLGLFVLILAFHLRTCSTTYFEEEKVFQAKRIKACEIMEMGYLSHSKGNNGSTSLSCVDSKGKITTIRTMVKKFTTVIDKQS